MSCVMDYHGSLYLRWHVMTLTYRHVQWFTYYHGAYIQYIFISWNIRSLLFCFLLISYWHISPWRIHRTHLHPYSPGLRHYYRIIEMRCQPSPQCQWNRPESRYKTTKNAIKCERYAYQISYITTGIVIYIIFVMGRLYHIWQRNLRGHMYFYFYLDTVLI